MPQLPPSARRRPSAKIPSRNDSGESPWKFFEPPRGGIERGVRPQKIFAAISREFYSLKKTFKKIKKLRENRIKINFTNFPPIKIPGQNSREMKYNEPISRK